MLERLALAWKQAITEGDNSTVCPVRVGGIGTAFVYHAAAAYMVFGQKTSIDLAVLGAYVEHMCMLMAAVGGTVGVKAVLKGDAK